MIIKIIEKDDTMVVCDFDGEKVILPIEDFQKGFTLIKDNLYQATDEFMGLLNDRVRDIEAIIPNILLSNKKSLSAMAALGGQVQEYCKKWGVTVQQAMIEIGEIYKRFVLKSIEQGIAFGEEHLPPNLSNESELRKRNESNRKKMNKQSYKPKGPTLGDMNPALSKIRDELKGK